MKIKIVTNAGGRLARMLGGIGLLASCFLTAESVRAADIPPVITIVHPQAGAASVSELESVIMEVEDDEPLPDMAVQYLLNGAPPSKGSVALSSSDEGRRLRVELAFALMVNEDYVFDAIATDSEGLTNSARIYFDTFDPNRIVIEAEDYNHGAGRFIDSPNLTPEGVPDQYAYWGRSGVAEVDFHDTSSVPGASNTYRPGDPVGLERSNDFTRQWFLQWGGAEAGIHDYSVAGVREGEWLEYTRTFVAPAFKVRLRQYVAGLPLSVTGLERAVTNDTVRSLVPLGVFLNTPNDGLYRTVPLTDGVGRNEVVFRPDAAATVRLKQLTEVPEGESLAHNFLVFIPVENPGVLRPLIAEVHPWPGETVSAADHEIRAVIVNRDRAVNVGTIELKLNGEPVVASVQPGEGMVTVTYPATEWGAGSTNVVELRFADNVGVAQTESWSYAISGDGVPRLESAAEVVGPYASEPAAVVDVEARTIRVAAPAQPRFYRLSVTGGTEPGPVRIESVRMENGEVVLNYGW